MSNVEIKADLKYTDDHEWLKDNNNGTATIGVSDFAAKALGDIVFVELPSVGKVLEKGASFGVVESIKSVSDLYAPVSGEVIEVNSDLPNTPEAINQNAYGSWMIKVKLSKPAELSSLMDAKAYTAHCEKH